MEYNIDSTAVWKLSDDVRISGYMVTGNYPGLAYRFGIDGNKLFMTVETADGKHSDYRRIVIGEFCDAAAFAELALMWARKLMPEERDSLDMEDE